MEESLSQRPELSIKLRAILGSDNVYFQPPPNHEMKYPCFRYELQDLDVKYADNGPYSIMDKYQLTFMHHDPDSAVIRKLLLLPHTSFSRHFATSGLNHDVFVIYHQ